MLALQESNEYESGKKKESGFIPFQFQTYTEVETVITCPKHGKSRVKANKTRTGEILGAFCPLCEQERLEEEKRREAERQERARIESYKEMNIAEEFYNKTFDDYKPATQKQKEFLDAIKDFLEKDDIEKLIVVGGNGTGKSMLGNLAVKAKGGLVYTMFEISLIVRNIKNTKFGNEYDFIECLVNAPILVVDEVGRSKGSEFEINLMSYVLDKRHAMHRKFIVLSNTHFSRSCPNGKAGCDKCFERFFDNDLLSRFRQNGKIIEIETDAPDWRDPRKK